MERLTTNWDDPWRTFKMIHLKTWTPWKSRSLLEPISFSDSMLNFGGVGMKFSPVLELEPLIVAHRPQEILHSSIIIILIIASFSLYTHRRVHLRPLTLERLLVLSGVVHLLFFGDLVNIFCLKAMVGRR